MLVDEGRQAGKYRLVARSPSGFFESSVHVREKILNLLFVKRSSHLGCGFNEKMAHKVAGRILKGLFFFIVLQISCFVKSSATFRYEIPIENNEQ